MRTFRNHFSGSPLLHDAADIDEIGHAIYTYTQSRIPAQYCYSRTPIIASQWKLKRSRACCFGPHSYFPWEYPSMTGMQLASVWAALLMPLYFTFAHNYSANTTILQQCIKHQGAGLFHFCRHVTRFCRISSIGMAHACVVAQRTSGSVSLTVASLD